MRGIHRSPVNSPHKGPMTRIFSIWWRHHFVCECMHNLCGWYDVSSHYLISLIGPFKIPWRWMPQYLTDDKSTLLQVKACCRQVSSRYLSRCRQRFVSPYGVARPHLKIALGDAYRRVSVWLLATVRKTYEPIFVKFSGQVWHDTGIRRWKYEVIWNRIQDFFVSKFSYLMIFIKCSW